MSQSKQSFEDYDAFVDKFKPKKTTDDCHTPQPVYDVVADYVSDRWGIDHADMVRPFWPGGDYESFDYPEGCVVVDNPPFSVLAKIKRFYKAHGVRFFLFCPALTAFGSFDPDNLVIAVDGRITYENGSNVRTAFVTNLPSEYCVEVVPELSEEVRKASDEYAKIGKKTLPKYVYQDAVLTAAAAMRLGNYGQHLAIRPGDCLRVARLDAQGKRGIFGGGLLLSERAAAERAAAERAAAERAAAERAAAERAAAEKKDTYVWELSPRELEMQKTLG